MASPTAPLRIVITGASGFIASALTPTLASEGHTVIPLSRQRLPGGIQWDPQRGVLDPAALEGMDAVIHLAGAGIADQRWTAARKRELRDSRVGPTALLANTIAALRHPPAVLVSMSAVGIYGDAGARLLTESSPLGDDFLGQLGAEWEAAAHPAREAGVRVVHPRMGVVISRGGGALPRMLLPFRLGIGGRLGHGRQWMSWIALDDALSGLRRCLVDEGITGACNLVAPNPIPNAEFTKTLARVLHRPAVIPVPAFALRVVFGELADATLLSSQRALPEVLESSGFRFRLPTLSEALKHEMDTPAPT